MCETNLYYAENAHTNINLCKKKNVVSQHPRNNIQERLLQIKEDARLLLRHSSRQIPVCKGGAAQPSLIPLGQLDRSLTKFALVTRPMWSE